ncbi:MAG: hypothetical protein Athens071416_550 [Parcubacteria group bacterium Athens0714_16]|nr:MAG: hypothetical protein Athens071416_550 [Parcubacteria group bacterium Athens0714_16]
MALLNLNRYFEVCKNLAEKIGDYLSWLKRKSSEVLGDIIFISIIVLVAIIIGIILATAYAFILGEEDILGWGLSHAVPILFLVAVSVFGCLVSLGVVKVMGGRWHIALTIFFWALTLFGPVIWTHLVKFLGAPEMVQYRRWTIFFPVVILFIFILVYGYIDGIRDEKINQKMKEK